MGGARLRVGEPAGALREPEGRIDGDLLVGGNAPERRSALNADLQIDGLHPPVERLLHSPYSVHATILSGIGPSDNEYARTVLQKVQTIHVQKSPATY